MISCLCVTAGRTSMLEEAIESFHRQDYEGEKELVVVNNHPDQTLVYDHPQVVVVNVPRKIATLGDARNFMASIARGDVLALWDDDDIHLPWKLRVAQAYLSDGVDYYRPYGCWWWEKGRTPLVYFGNRDISMFAGAAVLTMRCFQMVGGYCRSKRLLDDRIFDHEVEIRGIPSFREMVPLGDYATLYRYRWNWNVSDDIENPVGWDCVRPPERPGLVNLQPHWDQDYVAVIDQAARPVHVLDPGKICASNQDLLLGKGKR